MRSPALTAILVITGLVSVPGTAPAQEQVSPKLEVTARIGAYVPANNLYSYKGETRVSPNLSVGFTAQVPLLPRSLHLRGTLEWVPSYEIFAPGWLCIPGSDCVLCIPGSDCVLIDTRSWTGNSLVLLVTDLVLGPIPVHPQVEPQLLLGMGIKRYSGPAIRAAPATQGRHHIDFTLHIGAGVRVDLGGPGIALVEVSDFISWYSPAPWLDSEVQHDIVASLGYSFGLF